jgi:hypothetical protein
LGESDSEIMAKVSLCLGVIAFLAIMIFGQNNGPTLPFIATFPSFSNPFNSDRQQTTVGIISENTTQPPATIVNNRGTAAVPNCVNSTSPTGNWFGCVRTQDDIGSYVTLNFTRQVFWVNISNIEAASNLPVFDILLTIQCQSTDVSNVPMSFTVRSQDSSFITGIGNQPLGTPPPLGIDCPTSGWTNITGRIDYPHFFPTVTQFNSLALTVSGGSPQFPFFNVSVSYVSVTFEYGAYPECMFTGDIVSATAYIGCQIISFGTFLIKVFQLIVNVIVFVGSWLWTLVQLIGNFFAVVAWLYNIPGVPAPIQLFIDAVVTGLIASLLLILVRTLRGGV